MWGFDNCMITPFRQTWGQTTPQRSSFHSGGSLVNVLLTNWKLLGSDAPAAPTRSLWARECWVFFTLQDGEWRVSGGKVWSLWLVLKTLTDACIYYLKYQRWAASRVSLPRRSNSLLCKSAKKPILILPTCVDECEPPHAPACDNRPWQWKTPQQMKRVKEAEGIHKTKSLYFFFYFAPKKPLGEKKRGRGGVGFS